MGAHPPALPLLADADGGLAAGTGELGQRIASASRSGQLSFDLPPVVSDPDADAETALRGCRHS
jgi:hypothetical protein